MVTRGVLLLFWTKYWHLGRLRIPKWFHVSIVVCRGRQHPVEMYEVAVTRFVDGNPSQPKAWFPRTRMRTRVVLPSTRRVPSHLWFGRIMTAAQSHSLPGYELKQANFYGGTNVVGVRAYLRRVRASLGTPRRPIFRLSSCCFALAIRALDEAGLMVPTSTVFLRTAAFATRVFFPCQAGMAREGRRVRRKAPPAVWKLARRRRTLGESAR